MGEVLQFCTFVTVERCVIISPGDYEVNIVPQNSHILIYDYSFIFDWPAQLTARWCCSENTKVEPKSTFFFPKPPSVFAGVAHVWLPVGLIKINEGPAFFLYKVTEKVWH